MRAIAVTSLLLVLVLVSLSAYLRLEHSGIGCSPWPSCYGNIGSAAAPGGAADTYARLLQEARQPLAWATKAHRLVASLLGLLILSLSLLALLQKRDRVLSLALLALTVFLAVLGIRSGGLHDPAVVMGNLGGGFAMLGLLGWLVLREPAGDGEVRNPLHTAILAALALSCLQILVGGFTSANFAASACQTLPDCHGSWLPGSDLLTALDLSRVHQVGDGGFVLGGPERADIHKLHRLIAPLAFFAILLAAVMAIRSRHDLRRTSIIVITLVTLEFAVGVGAIVARLPIGLAVAHNWLAALLLLGLLRLYAEIRAAATTGRA